MQNNNQFTDKFLKSLPEKYKGTPKAIDVRENSGKGFAVTVFPSGEISFIYLYHFNGRKRRMTLGKYPHLSLAMARQLHRDALKILESKKDPAIEKKKLSTFEKNCDSVQTLITEYIEEWARPRKRSWKEDNRILNKDVNPYWGKRKARDITKRDVLLLLDNIKNRGAPIGANRTLACIRRMFNFAIERDIVTSNPCSTIKPPAKENRRERYLNEREIQIFWQRLDSASMSALTKVALQFQLVTAQRKGEIVSAEWKEIDAKNKVWILPSEKVKNNKTHRVPLSDLAIELLEELKKISGKSQWLFPAANTVKKNKHMTPEAVDHALRRNKNLFADIQDFSPHCLRATAATHMASMHISSEIISRILNHTKRDITSLHYNIYEYDEEKRHALDAWALRLREIINNEQLANNVLTFKKAI